ncbi:hypothetical protein [Streptomyces sp. NPDC018031]|uniref:hypothetical protein n=1 Tax=Streptomyces sp. NPDC018031 TaxID=3365033 RepID=UPI0037A70110
MPSYDSARDRFRLADRHIAALGHLVGGAPFPDDLEPSLADLRHAGLVSADNLISPLLSELLGVLDAPVVLIQVEVSGEHGLLNSGVLVGAERVFSHTGWPGEEESEYVAIEPAMLMWELARMVNLRRSEPVNGGDHLDIETSTGVLDAVFAELGQLPAEDIEREGVARERARATLAEKGGLQEPAQSLFADLITSLKASWRISVAWQAGRSEGPFREVRGLAVWDCGPHGYWHRRSPAEPIAPEQLSPETPLTLVRVSKGELWEMMADLLPSEAEITDEG